MEAKSGTRSFALYDDGLFSLTPQRGVAYVLGTQ